MKNKILPLLVLTVILAGCNSKAVIEEKSPAQIIDDIKIGSTTNLIHSEEVEENLDTNEKKEDSIIVGIQGHKEEVVTENIEDWNVEVEPYDGTKKLDPETEAKLRAMAVKLPERRDPTLEELYNQELTDVECQINPSDRACVNKLNDLKGVWYTGDDTEEGGLGFFIEIQGEKIITIGYPYSEMIYHIEVKEKKEALGHFLLKAEALDYLTDEKEDMVIEIKRLNYSIISFKINNQEPFAAWLSEDDLETFLNHWYYVKFEK